MLVAESRRQIRPLGLTLGLLLLGIGVWMIVTKEGRLNDNGRVWAAVFCLLGLIQLATGSYRRVVQ